MQTTRVLVNATLAGVSKNWNWHIVILYFSAFLLISLNIWAKIVETNFHMQLHLKGITDTIYHWQSLICHFKYPWSFLLCQYQHKLKVTNDLKLVFLFRKCNQVTNNRAINLANYTAIIQQLCSPFLG